MSKGSCFAKWGNLFWILGNFVLHSIPYFTIKRTYQQADFDNGSFLLVSMNHFNFWQFLWNQPAVSLKPDRIWQFFWNHPAVLDGFRRQIWPKMTKSKVSFYFRQQINPLENLNKVAKFISIPGWTSLDNLRLAGN